MGCFTLIAFLYLYLLRMGVNEDSNIPHRTGQNMRLMGAIRTKISYAGPLNYITGQIFTFHEHQLTL